MTPADLGYLAALVDGGCIAVTRTSTNAAAKGCKRGFSYRASIVVSGTDEAEAVLRWAVEATGLGSVAPKKPPRPGYQRTWAWSIWSQEAAALLRLVLPLLRVKRERAERLLLFQARMRFPGVHGLTDEEWNFRERLYAEFRVLNERGKLAA